MKKICVIFGGNSYEHNISCESARNILNNLDKNLYDISVIGIDRNNNWYFFNDEYNLIDKNWLNCLISKIDNIIETLKQFDLVLPIIHGTDGEDGSIQALFDLYNIKYIGCDKISSIICYDKELTKLYLDKLNIPQVDYKVLKVFDNINKYEYEFPVIIKPAKCGSSIGINIANNKKELKKYIKEAFKYDDKVIVEKFIKCRELECAILEDKNIIVSEIGEIFKNVLFYDYKSKYINKTSCGIAILPNDIEKLIKEYSVKVFFNLGCKDLSRIDFLYDEEKNKIYLNEINTMPGFTDISMYPILFDKKNISTTDLLNKIINNH